MVRSSLFAMTSPCKATRKRAGVAVDLEAPVRLGRRRRAGADLKRGAELRRRDTAGVAAEFRGGLRRDALQQRRHAVEPARIEIELHRAARRPRAGVDVAADRQRHAAEVADRKPLDIEAVRIEAHVDVGAPRLDSGQRRPVDPGGQQSLARHLEHGSVEQALQQAMGTVEIDVGRAHHRFDARRPLAATP